MTQQNTGVEVESAGIKPWDPFSAALTSNPYPAYEMLRMQSPVYWDVMLHAWIVTKYEDVRHVLLDDSFKNNNLWHSVRILGEKLRKDYGPISRALKAVLFFQNGDEHRRNRLAMTRLMATMPLRELEPALREYVATLGTKLEAGNSFDAITEFAVPIPATVMSRLMSLPDEDAPLLIRLGADFTRSFDLISVALFDEINARTMTIFDHLIVRIKESLAQGDEKGLSIIYAHAAGEDEEEKLLNAAAMAYFTFMVGTETTTSLIGSCVRMLVSAPEVQARLRADYSLAERFVAEVNRLDSAVQRAFRIASKDCEIGGQQIRKDDRIFLLLGAANRDRDKFNAPNEFKFARNEGADLAFGIGKHLCLGANLARLEAKIAVQQLLHMDAIEPADGVPVWHLGRAIRRLSSLPVRFIRN
jgi:pimeloyl-[acyl-carrier protein] synthase